MNAKVLLALLVAVFPLVHSHAQSPQEGLVARIQTPLGGEALRLTGFEGREALSTLFHYELTMLVDSAKAPPFEALLGQPVQVSIGTAGGPVRHFNGICARVGQEIVGGVGMKYRLELVPQMWFLTRKVNSRTFLEKSVPQIVQAILSEGGVTADLRLQVNYPARKFVVQYRESDFAVISRLMEEEGMYYFFEQSDQGHRLVIADTPAGHTEIPGPVQFDNSAQPGIAGTAPDRVISWEKNQEIRSAKYTLWDHCFEQPGSHLEATATIQSGVQVGKVFHKFQIAGNEKLEVYQFPGGYAQRFDGVDPAGRAQPQELAKLAQESKRVTVGAMQAETVGAMQMRGVSSARHLVAGHKFTLSGHYDADGPYVLTGVQHSATRGAGETIEYGNGFTCIPAAVPFRPARKTPKPVIQGPQTAIVTGPPGETHFSDQYGRVKVRFHWDRSGRTDHNSSCWVRVGTLHAGMENGFVVSPAVGDEVVVTFLEGDPDQPIIIGSVYNPNRMPPNSGR